MTDLDQINARLDSIERMLRQLLLQHPQTLPSLPVSDIRTEIAQVKAAGGDLVAHYKEKARRSMRQTAAEKRLRRSSTGETKGDKK